MSDQWRRAYFDRVRPALGELFFDRRVAVWDLGFGLHVAEALARTGIRGQVWFDDDTISAGDAATRSFGAALAGRPRGEALVDLCQAHNTFEDCWALERQPRDTQQLQRVLAGGSCQLLVARLDRHAPEVCQLAIEAGVPLVLAMVPATAALGTLQLVWTPRSRVEPQALIDLCVELAGVPQLDLDAIENHVDGLEAQDVTLALARWLLAPESPARPDLEQPLLEQGRAVILRGQPDWPWAVRFARPTNPAIRDLVADPRRRYNPPARLARGQRLLVIGLGTASLLCAEAALVAPRMLFVDCKAVSPENPVRQIYGTEQIGQPKGEALVELLCARLAPGATWDSSQGEQEVQWRRRGENALGQTSLRLARREPASVARFGALLDSFAPTIAVVGMGRSRDENFTATAELRHRGIRHVTPTAFPGVSHYKQIVTDGAAGPCYDCLQGHLAVDGGAGPTLPPAAREMYYGGTQPATLAETYPSAHSLLRLVRDLSLPPAARPAYLQAQLADERCCFVGANRTEQSSAGEWLYGVDAPFRIVSYGASDLVGSRAEERCPCGRINRVATVVEG